MEIESSLIVPIAAAMPDVEPWREKLDPFSARGMPTHVTVEYPFLPPEHFNADLTLKLDEMFGSRPSFRFDLVSVQWFDRNVAWLQPSPDDRFRSMTAAVMEQWPHLRPYGGPPGKVPPHVTIGVSESAHRLEEAARRLEPLLPIECTAEEVWLMAGSTEPGSWTIESRFPMHG